MPRFKPGCFGRALVACALAFGLVAPAVAAIVCVQPAAAEESAPDLPPFEGHTLDGKPLATKAFAGKRLILFCFNPGVKDAGTWADAVANIAPDQAKSNFSILGVAMGLDVAEARAFAKKHKLAFPVFDDSDGDINAKLQLQAPLVIAGIDAEGRAGLALVAMQTGEGPSGVILEARMRDFLRLPAAGQAEDGKLATLATLPKAPAFEAKTLDGSTFKLSDAAGKPVILVFFVPTCPHCQDALRFFKSELSRLPDDKRPVLVGATGDSRSYAVESALKEKDLDFFPVLLDPERKIATPYGSFGAVPDIILIDSSGRILFRSQGWDGTHDPDLMRMRLAKLEGRDVPMLVSRTGYSGNDVCSVCHEKEAATWHFTEHASAFNTLVTRNEDSNPKCVGCHVVGFGDKGGYDIATKAKHLENVGCENCHGKGGGHLDGQPKVTDYRAACLKCHDTEHSLGFDYATFLPKISHAVIASQSDADRAKRVANREKPRDLLPSASAFAGSESCRSCHAKEYDIWATSGHSHSIASLAKGGKQGEQKCVRCHVTGYGRPGGFPEGEKPGAHADLERVGCESCHGPGADHVKAGGKQAAGIVRLGDKCDSCVILQICGSCHDDANDPGFRFEVERKIDKIRHGAGSSKPLEAH